MNSYFLFPPVVIDSRARRFSRLLDRRPASVHTHRTDYSKSLARSRYASKVSRIIIGRRLSAQSVNLLTVDG
jgi:hypothetical protein